MLKDSLKWMAVTLFVVSLILFGISRMIAPKTLPAAMDAFPAESAPHDAANPVPDAADPLASPTPLPTPVPTETPEPDALKAKINGILSGMTTQEKLGQLVMFGFTGSNNPGSAYAQLFADGNVGNICLYGANIASADSDGGFRRAEKLIDAVESNHDTGVPLLVAIDVEGGSVVRFRWSPWPSSARTLGRKNDPEAARQQFIRIGGGLKRIGINMDLAPVLDIAEDPSGTFLKTRIISASADVAASIGSAAVTGLKEANCLSAIKHFPGHGGTSYDSHNTTPVIKKTLDELLAYDLAPFAEAIAAGADVTLVAHISYPELDAEHIASQSPFIITELLRNRLRFSGVVMSDDFRMRGLIGKRDASEAAVQFILAGGDLILCGPDADIQKQILSGLNEAAASGTLSMERIDESVARILQKKLAVCDWGIDASRIWP